MSLLGVLHYPNIDPEIFRIGPLAVRWYGVAWLMGFVISYLWLRRMAFRGQLRMSADAVGDLILYGAIGAVAGGRLGWWLFYHRPGVGSDSWYEPIAVWEGGMSFHGGLLGVVVAILLYSRRQRIPIHNLCDCAALVTPVGLFFGRIANFINAELIGRHSSVPWAMIFPGDIAARHPSQLYEAILEGPVLLAAVWAIRKWISPREGAIGAIFLIAYGLIRFLVEFTREPDAQLGYLALHLSMGQWLSLALVLMGVVYLGFLYRTPRADTGVS